MVRQPGTKSSTQRIFVRNPCKKITRSQCLPPQESRERLKAVRPACRDLTDVVSVLQEEEEDEEDPDT